MNENHSLGQCHCCKETTQVRWKNIYHMGSEGLDICMSCELKVVNFVRNLCREGMLARKEKYLNRKKR